MPFLPTILHGQADEETLKQLDSSVKRNTGFIKKLRQLSEENFKPLLDELAKLNQTRVSLCQAAAHAEGLHLLVDFAHQAWSLCSMWQRWSVPLLMHL